MQRRQFLKQAGASTLGVAGLSSLAERASAQSRRTPLITTRNHFESFQNEGEPGLTESHTPTDYGTSGDVPGLDTACAGDITIFVHGWDTTHEDAIESANEAQSALRQAGYAGTVVGYSWDADTYWGQAQPIAQRNGPKLANAVLTVKQQCPTSAVRLVCHSLGAQVVLSTLRTLAGWNAWTNPGYTIRSVHLLGAAAPNEAPTTRQPTTHDAIATQTTRTVNYHSSRDAVLWGLYTPIENTRALGQAGAETEHVPVNYTDYNATGQVGFNHLSYMNSLANEIVTHMPGQ